VYEWVVTEHYKRAAATADGAVMDRVAAHVLALALTALAVAWVL
jgi:hypothetical protein